jgi:hypothetical protein
LAPEGSQTLIAADQGQGLVSEAGQTEGCGNTCDSKGSSIPLKNAKTPGANVIKRFKALIIKYISMPKYAISIYFERPWYGKLIVFWYIFGILKRH